MRFDMAFTFFFRDMDSIKLIPHYVFSDLGSDAPLRIWDAGCANGPEIYSLLIYLKETLDGDTFERIRVSASDIDNSNRFEKIIECGRYRKNELMSVPPNILRKYFTKDENLEIYTVKSELRDKIVYRKHDLLSLKPVETGFNLIICKHVLQHFSAGQQGGVVRMFYDSLKPGGCFLTEYSHNLPEKGEDLFERVLPYRNLYRKPFTVEAE
jgi:chemotaxis protein methyltransferase CheR